MDDNDPHTALRQRSMEAFDSLPASFRQYCANYPRTARGQDLVAILAQCDGNITAAEALLAALLPAEPMPPATRPRRRRGSRG